MYLMLSTKQGCLPLQLVFIVLLVGNIRENKIKTEKVFSGGINLLRIVEIIFLQLSLFSIFYTVEETYGILIEKLKIHWSGIPA